MIVGGLIKITIILKIQFSFPCYIILDHGLNNLLSFSTIDLPLIGHNNSTFSLIHYFDDISNLNFFLDRETFRDELLGADASLMYTSIIFDNGSRCFRYANLFYILIYFK